MIPAIKSKKAQFTAFFILGLIIAVLLILGIYYRSIILSKFTSEEIPKADIEAEMSTIESYIVDCISSLANDGINQMGMHGGYINIPSNEIQINLANPLPSRLSILPGLETAYWFYDQGNGVQKIKIPAITSMQDELAKYIDDNLIKCTGDFSDYEGTVIYQKQKTKVTIKENSVLISTNFPVRLVKNETTSSRSSFSANIAKPLGKLYANAKQIMDSELQSNFLEEKTLDLFIVYDQIPYNGINFECNEKTWNKFEVMRNIKTIVSNNVQYLKIKGTNYNLISSSHKYFEVDALKSDDDQLNVNFMFSPDWPMFVDVLPDDTIMRSESFTSSAAGRFLTQFFCLNYYNFVYSIRYPVLISLTKDDYTFQFATQVIIDHNQPKENKVDINYLEGNQPRVCEHPLTNIRVNVLGYNPSGSLRPLNNAKVSFKCLGVVCDIGNGNNDLIFPQCINGMIIAENDGYNKNQATVSTNKEQEISINLEPIYEKNLSILITNEDGGSRALLNTETVMINFEDKGQDYATSAFYPMQKKIKLIAGNYNVKATLISGSTTPIQLKEETVSSCIDVPKEGLLGIIGLTEKKCSEAKIPAVKIDQVISGGEEFQVSFSRPDLASSSTLLVYVIKNKIPEKLDDIPEILEAIATNDENPNFKMPVLK